MNHKKSYAIAKHHAWAGSVLLAIILAIRLFLETYNDKIDNTIFIISGFILILYILISLMFTYKHRKGLIEQNTEEHISLSDDTITNKNIDKNQYKIQKKMAKSQQKIIKKQQKK